MKETEATTDNPKHRGVRGRYIVKYARLSFKSTLVSYFLYLVIKEWEILLQDIQLHWIWLFHTANSNICQVPL